MFWRLDRDFPFDSTWIWARSQGSHMLYSQVTFCTPAARFLIAQSALYLFIRPFSFLTLGRSLFVFLPHRQTSVVIACIHWEPQVPQMDFSCHVPSPQQAASLRKALCALPCPQLYVHVQEGLWGNGGWEQTCSEAGAPGEC